ncbi:hypothetical protein EVAR_39776_1 [Eumeta japonica]|uniref:Uncharacterized protein n=1 Tax=Eumeta variegata TaxID=151549 RepID=A0A4C1X4K1_EUMVA|nr:hypothetical protein EVAR_39776_1 [Eumeta japonica]
MNTTISTFQLVTYSVVVHRTGVGRVCAAAGDACAGDDAGTGARCLINNSVVFCRVPLAPRPVRRGVLRGPGDTREPSRYSTRRPTYYNWSAASRGPHADDAQNHGTSSGGGAVRAAARSCRSMRRALAADADGRLERGQHVFGTSGVRTRTRLDSISSLSSPSSVSRPSQSF